MHTDTDPMNEKHPRRNAKPTGESPDDPLFHAIAEAFEADARTVERLKARARTEARPNGRASSFSGGFSQGWVFRMALASALTLLIAIGVWRFPSTQNPPPPVQVHLTVEPAEGALNGATEGLDDGAEITEPTLVITNENGFVTEKAGGSQWLVLPGDAS